MRGYVRGITFGSSAFSDSDPIGLVRVHFRFVDEHNHEIFVFFFCGGQMGGNPGHMLR